VLARVPTLLCGVVWTALGVSEDTELDGFPLE
jgi:hypothetical protein